MMGDGYSECINEMDLFGKESEGSGLEWGTVGHDDAEVHYDLGTPENDGNVLVRVTLFIGRDRSKPTTPGLAQGHQILCQVSSMVYRIPPPGTRVLVAFPGGLRQVAGSGVIIATLEKAPANQFSSTRAKLDYGPDTDLVIKARSVTITDYQNRFIALGPDSDIMVQGTDGSGVKIQSGVIGIQVASGGAMKSALELTANQCNLNVNSGSMLQLTQDKASLFGTSCYITGAKVYNGLAPTIATGALIMVGGVPAPSLTCFTSP